MWPTMSTPRSSRPRAQTTTMPNSTATSDPHHRGQPAQPQHQRQRHQAEGQVGQWVSPRSVTRSQSFSKKSPWLPSTPNSLGSCPATMVRASPMMNP